MHNPSYAVIGTGLVGLCVALELRKRGANLTLIDCHQPGMGASYGNAGFLAEEGIEPLATAANIRRGLAMLAEKHSALAIPAAGWSASMPWLAKFIRQAASNRIQHNRTALHFLLKKAAPSWEKCLSELGLSTHLVKTPYLRVWESNNGLDAAQTEKQFYHTYGISAEFINQQQVAEIEPSLANTVHHAILLPHAHRVRDPYRLSCALLQELTTTGAAIIRDKITYLKPHANKVNLFSDQHTYTFDKVVVTAGVYSSQLTSTLGLKVPMIAERGYHLNLSGQTDYLHHPICSAERNVFLSPLENGLRITGFSELSASGLPAVNGRFDSLKHHLSALIPQTAQAVQAADTWMGERPTLPDSLPVIDTHPEYPQIGFAFGHQHLGLTLASATAELLVEELYSETPNPQLSPYRITRF